jgi:aspartate 1-decarboxylase
MPGARFMGDAVRRELLRAKIHRATVTGTDVAYEGSLTLDPRLMHAADLVPFERIDVYNVTNGSRLTTYVIAGEADSGVVCLNGAAALLARPGDKIIIAAYASLEEREIASHEPRVILVDERNRVVQTIHARA